MVGEESRYQYIGEASRIVDMPGAADEVHLLPTAKDPSSHACCSFFCVGFDGQHASAYMYGSSRALMVESKASDALNHAA